MKVLVIAPSFQSGGAEKVMIILANYLFKKVDSLQYVVLNDVGPYKGLLNSEIDVINLSENIQKYGYVKKNFIRFNKLRKLVLRNQDATLFSSNRKLNLLVYLTSFFLNCNLVFREASPPSFYKLGYLTRFIYFLAYSKAKRVIANSNSTLKDVSKIFFINESKFQCIYNPTLIKKVSNNKIVSVDSPKFIACGRLVRSKDYIFLIKKFSLIVSVYPQSSLTIIGEGPLRQELLEFIEVLGLSKNVTLEGYKEDPISYMTNFDVFLHSSKWEGFGSVFIEAAAAGLPVIAFNGGGAISEIVQSYVYGEIVSRTDDKKLLNEVEKVLGTVISSDKINEFLSEFSIELIGEKYLRALSLEN